jgi:glutamate formiminotransferase / 5-formyltetrahydrofolate cyclo-ligase
MAPPILLSVPNVSEGRDAATVAAIGAAFAGEPGTGVRTLDVHCDPDHHRSVFTLAGRPGELAEALLSGARVAVARIDVVSRAAVDPLDTSAPARAARPPGPVDRARSGQHPHVGALDVAPIVYLHPADRGAACAEALVIADRIGAELEVPVFLYGELSGEDGEPGRTRAQLRRGGVAGLGARIAGRAGAGAKAIAPDFGPARLHPSAGATLVAARPPLVAFNVQLAPAASVEDARRVAALIREGGPRGLPGVRAIGVALSAGAAQVSMNIERPFELSLAMVVDAVRTHAEVASAELVGLAPTAALEDFPREIPLTGFDPTRHLIENALGC